MCCVSLLPVGKLGCAKFHSTNTLVSETAALFASGSLTMAFTVFMSGIADPIDFRIVTDALVHGINHNDLIPFVVTVLANPVRV